jgi:hypothetical protein
MYITLVGNPQEGFTVVGPLSKSDGDGAVGEWARAEYGGSDFYQIELQGHGDPKGTAVVFDGDIGQPFEFYGPFPTIEKAEEWVAKNGSGVAMELAPIDYKEIESVA